MCLIILCLALWMIVMGVRRYKSHIWKFFLCFCLVFFCFYDIMFVSRKSHAFLKNSCRLSICCFTKDRLLQMYFSGISLVFKECLFQEKSFFCVFLQNRSLVLVCFPHISPFYVLPPNIPRSGPSQRAENMRRNGLYKK